MKKKIAAIISGALVVCLTFAMSSSLVIGNRMSRTPNSESNIEQGTDGSFGDDSQDVIGGETHAVKLAMSAYMMNRETRTVSRTLTATVLPVDAPDKSVDWSLEWCVPVYEGADISDYLTIEPEYDGALSATVTAYQGFEGGSAYVTCTTRVGGYSTQCLITYDGAPESLEFVIDETYYSNTAVATLTAGQNYDIELALDNTLGAVGSRYNNFEIKEVKMEGRFVAEKREIINGTVKSREDVIVDLSTGKIGDYSIPYTEFMTLNLSGNILQVNVLRSESSFKAPRAAVRTGTQYYYKAPYQDPRASSPDNCRLYVLVEETVSGKTSLLYIDIQSTVTSISLSENMFAF